jgi:hypothetical protein
VLGLVSTVQQARCDQDPFHLNITFALEPDSTTLMVYNTAVRWTTQNNRIRTKRVNAQGSVRVTAWDQPFISAELTVAAASSDHAIALHGAALALGAWDNDDPVRSVRVLVPDTGWQGLQPEASADVMRAIAAHLDNTSTLVLFGAADAGARISWFGGQNCLHGDWTLRVPHAIAPQVVLVSDTHEVRVMAGVALESTAVAVHSASGMVSVEVRFCLVPVYPTCCSHARVRTLECGRWLCRQSMDTCLLPAYRSVRTSASVPPQVRAAQLGSTVFCNRPTASIRACCAVERDRKRLAGSCDH